MTREEAKIKEANYYISPYKMIDIIYDDFDSRTCENCKYVHARLNSFGQIIDYMCHNDMSPIETECVKSDFGCNMFEKKDA